MTCDHCVRAVSDELSAVPGITDVSVLLNPEGPSLVTFAAADQVTDAAVAAAVDEAGYSIAD